MTRALDPLVSTKLRPSQDRPKLVARPRLTDVLTREAGRRLTLLSAPAGFGKTTLLNKWLKGREGGESIVAWLSLDEDDNEPVRFLSYLVAALRRIVEEEFGKGILAALRSPEPPRLEVLTGALVNELADLPEEVAIILDDYHLIDSEGVHGIVSFLLEHLPDGAHLVIASRVDPPLPLSRLRARSQITELGAADLAFTREEAAAFLKGVMGLDLSAKDVAKLEERTEGWIAGLQLAALSMRGREDLAAFVEAFSGTHRDVLDFLAEEVLERQPIYVRKFLLETSILTNLTGPLCDALTGRSDGQDMLQRLERENLFVVALDEERRWYRYHHLFADFLRGRLGGEDPELAGTIHLRASSWYEENGHPAEAIGHALSAPDHELAARLIGGESAQAFSRGEVPTVLRWLEALPAKAKRRRPRLILQHALALALTGRPDDAELLSEEAEREVGATGEDRRFLSGFASAVGSWCARLRGDALHAVELARRALSLLPDEAGGLRAFAAVVLGDALWTTGDLAAADEALAEAARIGRSAGHVYSTLSAMTLHARVQAERGRLREAGETLGKALRFVEVQRIELLPATGAIHIGKGALLYELNDLDEAERAGDGRRAGRTHGKRHRPGLGVRYALPDEACTARRGKRPRDGPQGGAGRARLRRGPGDRHCCVLDGAAAPGPGRPRGSVSLRARGASKTEGAAAAARVVDRITSARLLYARGRHHEALRLLEEPREAAEANGRTRDLIEALSLQALALWASNEREWALRTVTEALALAAPEGYIRTFTEEGQPMAEILSAALEARHRGHLEPPVQARYLRKLLAVLERDATRPALSAVGLPEPLTERELEVLKLVAAGKSNRRISSELFVSVGTVETHVNHLYRKLDAHSRTQAVARARELNLL